MGTRYDSSPISDVILHARCQAGQMLLQEIRELEGVTPSFLRNDMGRRGTGEGGGTNEWVFGRDGGGTR